MVNEAGDDRVMAMYERFDGDPRVAESAAGFTVAFIEAVSSGVPGLSIAAGLNALHRLRADPRSGGPEGFEAFRDAVTPLLG